MSRHYVTVAEIEEWANKEVWYLAASSAGLGSNKRLEMSNTKTFRVTDHGQEIYIGGNMDDAVTAYNGSL